MDTKHKYSDGEGKYVSQRQQLHEEIIKKLLALDNPPIAYLMGGGSGAGKSVSRELLSDVFNTAGISNITIVDADSIKMHLPEYKEYIDNKEENAAKWVHNESSDVSLMLIRKCISDKKSFIYDGTMKNKEKYEQIIDDLKRAGYKVGAWIVDCDLEKAKERAKKRAISTGRHVPPDDFMESHRNVSKTFFELIQHFDYWIMYDNSVDRKKPTRIAEQLHGKDPEYFQDGLFQKFRQKSEA